MSEKHKTHMTYLSPVKEATSKTTREYSEDEHSEEKEDVFEGMIPEIKDISRAVSVKDKICNSRLSMGKRRPDGRNNNQTYRHSKPCFKVSNRVLFKWVSGSGARIVKEWYSNHPSRHLFTGGNHSWATSYVSRTKLRKIIWS